MQAMAFPTPTAKDADGSRDTSMKSGSRRNKGRTLTDATIDLWQTPATDSFRSRGGDRKDEQGLDQQARGWATPTSSDLSSPREQTKGGRSLMTDAAGMWATPTLPAPHDSEASVGRERKDRPGYGTELVNQAHRWPSPRAEDSESCGNHPEATDSLTGATKNWPTPNASMMNDGESPESFQARADRLKEKHHNTNGAGRPLAVAAAAWPTPNSRDHKGSDLSTRNGGASLSHFAETGERTHGSPQSSPQVPVTSIHGGELSPTDPSTASRRRLNPAFVCWLMGWPWWWTNPGEISFARQAMESYLSRLRMLLSSLLGERVSYK